jgi:AraC-like DNA-binding protein
MISSIENMPLNIGRLEEINRSPGWHSYYHSHDFYEICYVVSGKGTISVEGVTYKVSAGDIFFHKPGERHKGKTFSRDPYELLVIGLDMVDEELQFMLFEKASKLSQKFDIKQKRNVRDIFENLLKEVRQRNIGHIILVRAFLMEIFVVIVREMLGQSRETDYIPRIINTHNKDLSRKAVEYLTANYKERLTVGKIAKRFYLSSYHFSRLFKKETSFSLIEYLVRIRIQESAKLLLTTNRAVKEIAYEVGFQDPYYFSKVFKKVYKSTPTQYRIQKTSQ